MPLSLMAQCSCPFSSLTKGPPKAWPSPNLNCSVTGDPVPTLVPFNNKGAWALIIANITITVVMMVWWLFFILVRLRLLEQWRRCCRFRLRYLFQIEPLSEQDLKLRELFNQRRLRRLQRFMEIVAAILPLCQLLGWLSFPFKPADDLAAVIYADVFESSFTMLTVLAFISLGFCSVKKMSVVRADVMLGLLYLALGALPTFAENDYYYIWLCRGVQCTQIVLGGMVSRVRSIWIPATLNGIWQVLLIVTTPALQPQLTSHLIGLACVQVAVFGTTFASEAWLVDEANAILGEMEASRGLKIANDLLGSMCDAVVPLSSELTLYEPCPRLAALLLSGNSQNNVGQPFQRFLTPADRPRFEEFLAQREQDCTELAGSIHVHLVDSMGAPVGVQLYHTSVPGLNGRAVHLIGVTEDKETNVQDTLQDMPSEAPMRRSFSSPATGRGGRLRMADIGGRKAAWELAMEAVPSVISSSWEPQEAEQPLQDLIQSSESSFSSLSGARMPYLVVDPSPPCTVIEVSRGVGKLFGWAGSQGANSLFAIWLEESHAKSFFEWLEIGVASAQREDRDMTATYGPVLMHLPFLPTRQKRVLLTVTVSQRLAQSVEVTIELQKVRAGTRARGPLNPRKRGLQMQL